MTFSQDGGGILIEHQGRILHLHSSRPEAEAEKLLSHITPQADSLLICGAGLGYLLEKALERPHLRTIFVIEPCAELSALCLRLRPLLKQLKNNPRTVWIESPEGLESLLQKQSFSELALIVPRSYGQLFAPEIKHFQNIFSAAFSRKEVSKNTLVRFGKIWVKNFLRNLPLYPASLSPNLFMGAGAGKPAVVIGAGPSLDEALPLLKRVQEAALLIAADTALPMLEAAGIAPDFVVSVDPQELNAYYLRLSQKSAPYLVADPGLHPSAFEGRESRTILCGAAFPFYEFFRPYTGARGVLASGGSVSTSAFDFARILGCDPILLAGQDLAFTQRKTHGAGNVLWELGRAEAFRLNPYHDKQARSMYPSHSVLLRGRSGGSVRADARLAAFAGWFSQEISKTPARVYTAGLEGAALEGAQSLSTDEAFGLLSKPILKPSFEAPKTADKAPLAGFLQMLIRDVRGLIPLAARAEASPGSGEGRLLQERLSALPVCTRLAEVGMQDRVWKTLDSSEASENELRENTRLLAREIRENLRLIERSLKKSLLRL